MNNLYSVENEDNLINIMKANTKNIIIIMFSNKECPPCQKLRPVFKSMANDNTQHLFLYVDLSNYKETHKYFTKNVELTPTFCYYYNGNLLHITDNLSNEVISKLWNDIKINEKKEILDIIDYIFTKYNLKPNTSCNYDTEIIVLKQELDSLLLHVDEINNKDTEKKERDLLIKEFNELHSLKKNLQQQYSFRINQLKNIYKHKLKELS
jgi:thiol-disulfide isomerase/thioredoxin